MRGYSDSKPNNTPNSKPPQIALLPVNSQSQNNNQVPQSTVYTNPYNTKMPSFNQEPTSTTFSSVSTESSTSSSSTGQYVPSSTQSTTTTRGKQQYKNQHTSIHLRPQTSQRPLVVRTQDNEIPDSGSNIKGYMGKPSKIAAARLNMGGIIALGIFGGFVFLAAVITIIVIIVRRYFVVLFYS